MVSVEAVCMECSLCIAPLEEKGVLFPPVKNYTVAHVRFLFFFLLEEKAVVLSITKHYDC